MFKNINFVIWYFHNLCHFCWVHAHAFMLKLQSFSFMCLVLFYATEQNRLIMTFCALKVIHFGKNHIKKGIYDSNDYSNWNAPKMCLKQLYTISSNLIALLVPARYHLQIHNFHVIARNFPLNHLENWPELHIRVDEVHPTFENCQLWLSEACN